MVLVAVPDFLGLYIVWRSAERRRDRRRRATALARTLSPDALSIWPERSGVAHHGRRLSHIIVMTQKRPARLPVLPLRDIVVFPDRIVPLFVGREKSVAALEAAMASGQGHVPRRPARPGEDDPDRDQLYDSA